MKDWDPYSVAGSSLRPSRVPLDLVRLSDAPPSSGSRETPRTIPIARPYYEEDENEEEKATLARFVPLNSEIRQLLDDPEETLALIRKAQASLPDPDSALDSLVSVYEERVERLAREREEAAERARAEAEAALARRTFPLAKRPAKPLDRAITLMQPHFWKIVYSTICVWGLLQLALTR